MNRSAAALSPPSPTENPYQTADAKRDAGGVASRWLWRRYATFFAIAILGCAADLLTKHWVFEWRGMPQHDNVWWILEGYVGIETALNPGALFGFGKGFGLVFATLSIGAAVGVLFWITYGGAARDWLLTIALGCVLAGIGGNLFDRLGLWHPPGRPDQWRNEVRDWILFRWGEYTWPNFNIADSLLVCGAALLFWHSFRQPAPTEEKRQGECA